MRLLVGILLLSSFAGVTAASATCPISGNDLLERCKADPGFKNGTCMGFIIGVAQFLGGTHVLASM